MSVALAETLNANRRLQSHEAVAAFERAVLTLREQPRDPAVLPQLLLAFCDAEDYGMMWTLLTYVESFEHAKYVRVLVETTPTLLTDARRWLDTLYTRTLNAEAYRLALKSALENASPEQVVAVRQVFNAILEGTPDSVRYDDFLAKIAFVTPKL